MPTHALRKHPGGLQDCTVCTVCTAAEGELLPTCPGYALTAQEKEFCYIGLYETVADIERARARLEAQVLRLSKA